MQVGTVNTSPGTVQLQALSFQLRSHDTSKIGCWSNYMRMFCAWILTLLAASTAFIGLAMLVMLPIQAAQNRELLERVKQVAAFQAKTGHLPKQYQYDPSKDGIGSMWVDRLDECDRAFMPPRSDRFVVGFWQGDWWHCYGYPSGVTNLHTSVAEYLASETALEILINGLVAAAAFWGAARLRRGNENRDLGLIAKAAWFGGWMVLANLLYDSLDKGDDEYTKNPGYIKWFVDVFDNTVGRFEYIFLRNDQSGLRIFIENHLDNTEFVAFLLIILFLFWTIIAYLVDWLFKFSLKLARFRRQAK